jgi:hypothetical protein
MRTSLYAKCKSTAWEPGTRSDERRDQRDDESGGTAACLKPVSSGKLSGFTVQVVSATTDFSFDFQDLEFSRLPQTQASTDSLSARLISSLARLTSSLEQTANTRAESQSLAT